MFQDAEPGSGLTVKMPGGYMFFDSTKQYELIVVDPNTLATTVDYISVMTGNGPFIQGSPQIVATLNPFGGITLQIQVNRNDNESIDSVVLGGTIVPREVFSVVQGILEINLSKLSICFGNGDLLVTVVKGGQSDTTTVRLPELQLSCGEKG
jgi:hypothetical protein